MFGLHFNTLSLVNVSHWQLPRSIIEFTSQFTNKSNRSDILTHCKRELVQAVWKVLLDDEFVEAYKNGMVVKCWDGVHQCIFP